MSNLRFAFIVIAPNAISNELTAQDDSTANTQKLKDRIELLETKLKAVELERDALLSKVESLQKLAEDSREPAETPEEDHFQEGSRWHGSRFYTQKGADPLKGQDWTLVITKRKKTSFESEIHFTSIDDRQQVLTVAGTAPIKEKGQVRFKTNQKGVFQQTFAGNLSGGQISPSFTGTGVTGAGVTGTGNLKK